MTRPGFFEIFSAARPALPAGEYELATDQRLSALPPDGPPVDVDVPGTEVHFDIVSPRYHLPPDQLLSIFPPAGAVGDWRDRLPQVVCKRRTLPWERNPGDGEDDDAPPWLALVVLAEGEGALSEDTDIADCVTPGVVLDGANDTETGHYLEVTEDVVKAVFPTVADLSRLTHVRRVDLEDTELALGDDDGYLAVVMAGRLPQPGPPTEQDGPPVSRNYTAYLVNVEGQLDRLPEDSTGAGAVILDFPVLVEGLVVQLLLADAPAAPSDDIVMKPPGALAADVDGGPGAGTPTVRTTEQPSTTSKTYGKRIDRRADPSWATGPTAPTSESANPKTSASRWRTGVPLSKDAKLAARYGWSGDARTVRFPVLLSWDFVCTGEGTFESLMTGLDTAMLGTVPDAPTSPEVAPTGHVALEHTTRRGEPAVAWYRGPLVPLPTERATSPVGDLRIAHSADEIRPVVPDGREDVGRAGAFEIGRLLALSKPGVVAAMTAWREELFGAARAAAVAARVAPLPGAADAVTAGGRRVEDLLAKELVLPYAERAGAAGGRIAPRMRDVALSRTPEAFDGLEASDVLVGLGIDPAHVSAAVETDGLSGWSAITPTDAGEQVIISADPSLVELLRAAVDAHVEARAADALRLGELGVPGGRGPVNTDVLDVLLRRGRAGGGQP